MAVIHWVCNTETVNTLIALAKPVCLTMVEQMATTNTLDNGINLPGRAFTTSVADRIAFHGGRSCGTGRASSKEHVSSIVGMYLWQGDPECCVGGQTL
jgi:hypothetical protein